MPAGSAHLGTAARRISAGDVDALDVVVDHQYDRLVAIARRFTGRDHAFAEDAAQEALLKLVRKLPRLTDEEHLSRWLAHAVRLACLDRLRAQARQRRRDALGAKGELPGLDGATLEHLRRAMIDLSADERLLLTERFGRDRELAAIGHLLGLSRDAVKGRLARAIAKLAGAMKE